MHFHIIAIVLLSTLAIQWPIAECGPARSLAYVAQRTPKIPISIRAPFKHTETMVARGYGKRAYPTNLNGKTISNELPINGNSERDQDGLRQYLLPRGYGKRYNLIHPGLKEYQNYGKKEMGFLDDANMSNDGNTDTTDQDSAENNHVDGVPIEWVTNELTTNPGLLKAILYRFVDTNKDGILTSPEFLGTSNNDSNNNSY